MFRLTSPCKLCPFRVDALQGWLGAGRAAQIADSILEDNKHFPCHETVDYDREDEEEEDCPRPTDKAIQFCAGALWLIENEQANNAVTQIGERLKFYDPDKLRNKELIVTSRRAFIEKHT